MLFLEVVLLVSYCKLRPSHFLCCPFIRHRPSSISEIYPTAYVIPSLPSSPIPSRLQTCIYILYRMKNRTFMSRASFRRSGAAAPPSSTTPFVLTVNVDIPSLIVHLDTMSMLLSRSNVGREGAPSMMFCNRLKTMTPRRLYWVRPPNPEHI